VHCWQLYRPAQRDASPVSCLGWKPERICGKHSDAGVKTGTTGCKGDDTARAWAQERYRTHGEFSDSWLLSYRDRKITMVTSMRVHQDFNTNDDTEMDVHDRSEFRRILGGPAWKRSRARRNVRLSTGTADNTLTTHRRLLQAALYLPLPAVSSHPNRRGSDQDPAVAAGIRCLKQLGIDAKKPSSKRAHDWDGVSG